MSNFGLSWGVRCDRAVKEYTIVLSQIPIKDPVLKLRLIELKLAVCAVDIGHVISELAPHGVDFFDDFVTIKQHESCSRRVILILMRLNFP